MDSCQENKSLSQVMDSLTLVGTRYDDGYDSAASEEKSECSQEEEEEEEEPILEPLCILEEKEEQSVVYIRYIYISKGLTDNRYCPYTVRNMSPADRRVPRSPTDGSRVIPVLRIKRIGESEPTKLETVNLKWQNNNELRISKTVLPKDIQVLESMENENKIQIFLQFDPSRKDLKCFLADLRSEVNPQDNTVSRYVGPIVIFLKADISVSQEQRLLSCSSMEERTAAYNLVEKKEIGQLVSGLPPHDDTVLSVLCAQKDPTNRGQNNAQIHAVVQRLVGHQDKTVRETIFKVNKNRISALEIAAITNNHAVACYLVEVIYNITDDMDVALDILNCKDSQNNTIIHLLARKGDANIKTLRSLLDIRLTDGSPVYRMLPNLKAQYPVHIACQSRVNQPETLSVLSKRMENCFEVADSDGMTALHYACQRTNDATLVTTILSYKKDNINAVNLQGLTALDLVTRRGQEGPFSLESAQQAEIIKLLRNNRGRSALQSAIQSPSESPTASSDYSSSSQSYEDRMASQVLEEFPELSSLLEKIMDGNQ